MKHTAGLGCRMLTEKCGRCSLEARIGTCSRPDGKFYLNATRGSCVWFMPRCSLWLMLPFYRRYWMIFKHCFLWIVETDFGFFPEPAVSCLFPCTARLLNFLNISY